MPLKERKGYEKNIDNNAFFLMIKKKMKNTYFKYYFSVYLFIIQLEFQTFSLSLNTLSITRCYDPIMQTKEKGLYG